MFLPHTTVTCTRPYSAFGTDKAQLASMTYAITSERSKNCSGSRHSLRFPHSSILHRCCSYRPVKHGWLLHWRVCRSSSMLLRWPAYPELCCWNSSPTSSRWCRWAIESRIATVSLPLPSERHDWGFHDFLYWHREGYSLMRFLAVTRLKRSTFAKVRHSVGSVTEIKCYRVRDLIPGTRINWTHAMCSSEQ